jgi:hypothetical protein
MQGLRQEAHVYSSATQKAGLRQEAHVTVSGEGQVMAWARFVCQAFVLIRRARDRSDGLTAIPVGALVTTSLRHLTRAESWSARGRGQSG